MIAAAEDAARALFAAEASRRPARDRTTAQRETVDRLRAGLAVYPPEVDSTLAELASRGILAELLAAKLDSIEGMEGLEGLERTGLGGGPGPPGRGEALEAALGDARYALLVGPGQEEEVLSLARSHGFPGPVYGGERTQGPERIGLLELQPGAPVWLRDWPGRIELRDDGAWRDERGLWGAPPRGRGLGASGRQAALARAEAELAAAEEWLREAEAALPPAREHRAAADAALAVERRRRDLLAEVVALPAAREEAQAAAQALGRAEAERDHAATAREEAHQTREAAVTERARAEIQAQQLAARLRGEREALERTEAELAAAEPKVRELSDRVSPALRTRAERGELDGPDTVSPGPGTSPPFPGRPGRAAAGPGARGGGPTAGQRRRGRAPPDRPAARG